jgi:hypothetical protein
VDEFLKVRMSHTGPATRELTFAARGERYEKIIERLRDPGNES